jgi:hypothetical protein
MLTLENTKQSWGQELLQEHMRQFAEPNWKTDAAPDQIDAPAGAYIPYRDGEHINGLPFARTHSWKTFKGAGQVLKIVASYLDVPGIALSAGETSDLIAERIRLGELAMTAFLVSGQLPDPNFIDAGRIRNIAFTQGDKK